MAGIESASSASNPEQAPQPRLRRSTTVGLDLGDGDIDRIIEDSQHGYVDNPFRRWDPEVVDTISRLFARSYNLRDKEELFAKAGQILRNPTRWRRLDDQLERDEREALMREQGSFWQQPKMLQVTIVLLCFCAMVQGWTQTVSNVANLNWPKQLGLSSFHDCVSGEKVQTPHGDDVWIFAIVNASTYFAASMVGCWLSDPLSELFLGRRTPIFISAILILASTIGAANCAHWPSLLVCRILLGMGMGCKATVTPVFAAEVAPNHLRGTLVVNWQLFNALGICLGFASNLALFGTGDRAWRYQTATLCAPTTVILVLTYICPESPRFQMKKSSQDWSQRMSVAWRGRRGVKTWFTNVAKACFFVDDRDVDDHENDGDERTWTHHGHEDGHELSVQTSERTLPKSVGAQPNGDHPEPSPEAQQPSRDPVNPGERRSDEEPLEAADYRKAFRSFVELRGCPILAAKELLYVHVQMVVEMRATFPQRFADRESAPASDRLAVWLLSPTDKAFTYPQKIRHLWSVPRIRRATSNAVVCMISQQLCGVNVLAFYSSTVFSTTICQGGTDPKPLWLGFGIGVLFCVFGIPAYWTIERPGRRASLLFTLPCMAVFMLGACLAYKDETPHVRVMATFAFLFIAAYSPGMGPVPFTMSSEVFPLEHRMVGMSVSVFFNLFGAGVLALIVPPLSRTTSGAGNVGLLGIFTVLNIVAFGFILLFVRETAGTADETATETGSGKAISLEELTYIFQKSTKEFLDFQMQHMLPYTIDCLMWPGKRIWSGWLRGEEVERPHKPKMVHTRDGAEMRRLSRVSGSYDGNFSV